MTRTYRGRALLAIGATVALIAGIAAAQETIPIGLTIHVKVTPDKAGTRAHPQGITIDVKAKLKIPEAYEPPLVDTVDVWFPRNGIYNGNKFPTCSQSTLARRGPKACPAGSIMGHGTVKATADTVFTYPKVTIVNGGQSRVYFYTVLNNPARVQTPVPGIITKLSSGPWAYKLHTDIPRNLQIVAGIPIVARSARFHAGRGDWIASTSCPSDHYWRYHVELTFTSGQIKRYNGRVPCRS
ncbi:MAG: hypothetical protein ACJ762_07290 [Solirubrobacteraceae bacterium]